MHAQVPKGNMGYDQHKVTVPDTVAVEPTFVVFFSTGKHKFMASLAFFQISNLSRNSCILRASIFKSTNLQSGLCV